MKFEFISDAYRSRSRKANSSETINYFLEANKGDKGGLTLYGCPGLISVASGSGEVRGALVYSGIAYVVIGDTFYSMDPTFTLTSLGTMSTATGYVNMKTNGLFIVIVDGTYGYTYDLTNPAFLQISDPDFPSNPTDIDILDGIFIVIEGASQRFWTSTDGVSWDGLDFASAESNVDNLINVIVDHQEVVFGGDESIEVFYNSGATFPFSRRAVIETGMVSPGGKCKADNSVFFLGNDGVVWRLNGYTPTRVSTHAVEYSIQQTYVSDCIMWPEKREGHLFIWCQFPRANITWVFDVSTNAWHRRAYRDPTSGQLERHRANCFFFFNHRFFVGDHSNGKIYESRMDVYDDDGDPLPAIRVCKHVAGGGLNKIFHHRLQLDIEPGVGLVTGQGDDPQMMLKWSDDGGITYGNEVWRSMGKIGEYRTKLVWSRLGGSRDRVYWSEITDPVKRVIVGAALDTTEGR